MHNYDIKCETCDVVVAHASFIEEFAANDPHLRTGLCPACTLIKFPPPAAPAVEPVKE